MTHGLEAENGCKQVPLSASSQRQTIPALSQAWPPAQKPEEL